MFSTGTVKDGIWDLEKVVLKEVPNESTSSGTNNLKMSKECNMEIPL